MKIATFTGNAQTVFTVKVSTFAKRFWAVLTSGTGGSVALEFNHDPTSSHWFSLTTTPLVISAASPVDYTPISNDVEVSFRATGTGFGITDTVEIHVTGDVISGGAV